MSFFETIRDLNPLETFSSLAIAGAGLFWMALKNGFVRNLLNKIVGFNKEKVNDLNSFISLYKAESERAQKLVFELRRELEIMDKKVSQKDTDLRKAERQIKSLETQVNLLKKVASQQKTSLEKAKEYILRLREEVRKSREDSQGQ
jgi:chromosome segregation ATPase